MKILLVDTDTLEGAVIAGQLGERGHEVLRCFDEQHDLCMGLDPSAKCPVESVGCDVALVVREPGENPSLREMGAVCAVRRHIPVVVTHSDEVSPFHRVADESGTAVVEYLETMDTDERPGLEKVVVERLRTLPAIRTVGVVPSVSVRRAGDAMSLVIGNVDAFDENQLQSIVTWAARALREADPHTSSVAVMIRD